MSCFDRFFSRWLDEQAKIKFLMILGVEKVRGFDFISCSFFIFYFQTTVRAQNLPAVYTLFTFSGFEFIHKIPDLVINQLVSLEYKNKKPLSDV